MRRAALPNPSVADGTTLTALGWGQTTYTDVDGEIQVAAVLQSVSAARSPACTRLPSPRIPRRGCVDRGHLWPCTARTGPAWPPPAAPPSARCACCALPGVPSLQVQMDMQSFETCNKTWSGYDGGRQSTWDSKRQLLW